jgi:crotonobetainyl-CoA:carnitine CoA-transferase CaiB-like acyl-CoA transferase
MLAWLGADGQIEPPGRGDPVAASRMPARSRSTSSTTTAKRSIVLDLAHPVGRALLLRLVPSYDVFASRTTARA